MDTKFCTKCGVEKPANLEHFYKEKRNKSGLYAHCKICSRQISKQYTEKNKEKINDRNKKYEEKRRRYAEQYRKTNKEKVEEYQERVKEIRKEYFKQHHKEYQKNNKERLKKYHKEYCKNNKDLINGLTQARRALKLSLPSTLTLKQWQSTKDHFNHECAYCGKQLKNLVQEHVIPLSKCGGYTKGNIIPSCKSCNSSKNASNMKTWYTTQSYFSIERYNKILAFIKEHKSIHDYTPITKEG